MLRSLVLALALTASAAAIACSCDTAMWSTAESARNSVDAIFVGVPATDSVVFNGMNRTRFSVISNLKNTNYKAVNLYTRVPSGANCGTSFYRDSGVMVVLAGRQNGRYVATSCGIRGLSSSPWMATFLRELKGTP
jgi:hypothetical protein